MGQHSASGSLIYEDVSQDLKMKNYVEVPFSLPHEEVEKTARDFLDFLTLPQEVKDSFTFILDENDRGSNAGYACKNRAKGDSDNKEYFNYRQVTEQVLSEQIRNNVENPKMTNFLQSARRLFDESVKTLREVIKVVDTRHKGLYEKVFSSCSDCLIALRFVKYDPSEQGSLLAKAHYDRSACTLAVAESAPGLRIGRDESSLKEVARHGNTVIFFPSFTFASALGSNEFAPGWHDVIQQSGHSYSKGVARWSIILFTDVKSDEVISYEDAHTPQNY